MINVFLKIIELDILSFLTNIQYVFLQTHCHHIYICNVKLVLSRENREVMLQKSISSRNY